MKNLVVNKGKIQDLLSEYISCINSDKVRIVVNDDSFTVRPVAEELSVLDRLSAQADHLGPGDMSENVDRFLYNLPRRK